ncbi:MAG: HAD family hydrolase [Candidatus Chisholmbacteria bacterium]|nr:HAD family hydrolase [Candidatus Chisholmbacteria bacterium]
MLPASYIALDIGGILFRPLWRQIGIKTTSQLLEVTSLQFLESFNRYKQSFYTGKINEDEFWQSVLKKLKLDLKLVATLKKIYRQHVSPIPENFNQLDKLKVYFNLVSFNNSPKEWMDYRVRRYKLKKYFSKFVTSGYTGYIKPSLEAFSILTKLTKTHRNKIIYLDDNVKYVQAAKIYSNIICIHYQNPQDLSLEALRKF